MTEAVERLTKKSEDSSRWYLELVRMAKLADYGPVRGTFAIRPYGFAIWERIQADLDARFKATGHVNAYFPLLIPESYLTKEAEHVEGFAPECAWVTVGGDDELEERLAIRPTSESIICDFYRKWIHSYRDLPVLINQWCNVLRWEMVTRPFLRTAEFLWQEGHTVHATAEEAREEALRMLNVYRDCFYEVLAIPVLTGMKSPSERFAGAVETFTCEGLMGDGRALQAATSHDLGQNFARAFDITFLDENQERVHPYQTSWGFSTRTIGALILVHGDDRGLRLPPKLAPTQAVVVPIWRGKNKGEVRREAEALHRELAEAGLRAEADLDEEHSPGWKFNEHELRGVPVRVELGPKDIEKGQAVLVRRDTGEKEFVGRGAAARRLVELMDEIQQNMLRQAEAFRDENTRRAETYEEFKEIIEEKRGFVVAPWDGTEETEQRIKEETKATIRLLPFEREEGKDLVSGRPGKTAVFARAY
ncbi:prolyl-tRNA synthetase [Rubrobacter xylanophilus DSM 9941]|uniref:Proline--tRNA ligase n=1 Tax=Rubrobacter xylanophilus (strain DSM 9941 / JCM 11954 / NBRC 16129 / PRD-1) TaxID=266117 RepID=SYP_RUBXD|nr:proline--tRNA ligase [Rubrobacter xylanophilus]Q1AX25.1 RecName: Full=Proline--tRNA ligase; AltName: Full=Prolyl-tRNA synthetase; Short=ProRS [Rubrobacter xylanophilus DSM 9941]ABG04053.1 prolyl-tRNA synthetase [Rubrobacter xylanophilus DSM 9941]